MTPDKLAKAKKQLADMVLIFDFKPNKTYTVTGSPGGSQSGHWSQKGTSVSVDDAKSKGAPKVMQLSKNGKVLAIAFAGMKLILNKSKRLSGFFVFAKIGGYLVLYVFDNSVHLFFRQGHFDIDFRKELGLRLPRFGGYLNLLGEEFRIVEAAQ